MAAALTVYALTTLEEVRGDLGLTVDATQDGILRRMINAVSQEGSKLAGRLFHYEAGATEDLRRTSGVLLHVRRTPIVSLTKIETINLDGDLTEVDSASYRVDQADQGRIVSPSGWGFSGSFAAAAGAPRPIAGTEVRDTRVTFDGGWITPAQEAEVPTVGVRTLPYDLEEATLAAVKSLWGRRTDTMGVKSEKIGDAAVSYDLESVGGLLLPKDVVVTFKAYRKPTT